MMTKFSMAGLALAGMVCATASIPAHAAPNPEGGSLVARTKASPGCPSVGLHIIREGSTLSGVVFRVDHTGVSTVTGTTDGDKFSWVQTSINGAGPTGTVDGTISNLGVFKAHIEGTACSFQTTIPMLRDSED